MEHGTVTDLYEATWLIMNGCILDTVECLKLSRKLTCRISFHGKNLRNLQEIYYNREAEINLFYFRQCYNQLNGLLYQAKKDFTRHEQGLSADERAAKGYGPGTGGER